MKLISLVSGGMDSVTAMYEAKTNHEVVVAISFKYGAKHNHREIPLAVLHCWKLSVPHIVIDLGFVSELFRSNLLKSGGDIPDGHYEDESMKKTVVPFRNGIMLSVAAGVAESLGAQGLLIASHAGDHAIYPDCRETFMQHMSSAISTGTYGNVSILRPFIDKTKAEIVIKGVGLGVDFNLTYSCYKGGEKHCGTCGTCTERKEAFALAMVPDPTVYESSVAKVRCPDGQICDIGSPKYYDYNLDERLNADL